MIAYRFWRFEWTKYYFENNNTIIINSTIIIRMIVIRNNPFAFIKIRIFPFLKIFFRENKVKMWWLCQAGDAVDNYSIILWVSSIRNVSDNSTNYASDLYGESPYWDYCLPEDINMALLGPFQTILFLSFKATSNISSMGSHTFVSVSSTFQKEENTWWFFFH